jgi:hypothetical protein
LSAEEQIVAMEVERARSQSLVDQGALPPLPPTIITPGSDSAAGSSANNTQAQTGAGQSALGSRASGSLKNIPLPSVP